MAKTPEEWVALAMRRRVDYGGLVSERLLLTMFAEAVAEGEADGRRATIERVLSAINNMPRSRGWTVDETLLKTQQVIRALDSKLAER